uniref:Ground-like domain-containing protein n=1 Tax=Rhabditophanes sp. KR3021 TaxID=114890 RepID=A0AC35UG42_9BILA
MKYLVLLLVLVNSVCGFIVFEQMPPGGGGGGSGGCCGPPPCPPPQSCGCGGGLPPPPPMPQCGRKKRSALESPKELSHDGIVCTDQKLRKVIDDNITENVNESISGIRRALMEKETDTKFVVLCGSQSFSFKSRSDKLCVVGNGKVACHIFEM